MILSPINHHRFYDTRKVILATHQVGLMQYVTNDLISVLSTRINLNTFKDAEGEVYVLDELCALEYPEFNTAPVKVPATLDTLSNSVALYNQSLDMVTDPHSKQTSYKRITMEEHARDIIIAYIYDYLRSEVYLYVKKPRLGVESYLLDNAIFGAQDYFSRIFSKMTDEISRFINEHDSSVYSMAVVGNIVLIQRHVDIRVWEHCDLTFKHTENGF